MSFFESLRRLSSGGGKPHDTSSGPTSPRTNVWSSTFDPGRNANLAKAGSSYYDKPSEANPGSVWDQHIKSEESRPQAAAGSTPPAGAAGSRMISSDAVQRAMKQAETNGKVDYDKFMTLLGSKK